MYQGDLLTCCPSSDLNGAGLKIIIVSVRQRRTGAGGTFDGAGSVTTVLFTVYIIFSSVCAFWIQATASWVITHLYLILTCMV